MPCVKRKLFALALLALTVFLPNTAFATTATKTCECFCGADGTGAVDKGKMLNTACQKTCKDEGMKYVGCYLDSQQYPNRNPKCWTKTDCEAWSGKNGVTPIGASWQDENSPTGKMPYECMANKTSGDETRYCYADDASYTLNIPVAGTTEVGNLPTYINVLYAWALPAASLVAVVMMMLGGLQYVLSRGKEKYIAKGKERITNAITGLVLLLSVFVILNLIDPRLTSMNALKIPMIKEITMLDAASSCERLADYGYKITTTTTPESCGGKGKIENSDNLEEGVLGSWKDGDECDYMKCLGADAGESCVREGDKNVCKSCADYPDPSDSACSALEQLTTAGASTQIYCKNMLGLSCATVGQSVPSTQGINCADLQTKSDVIDEATKERTGCSVYEKLKTAWTTETPAGSGIRVSGTSYELGGTNIISDAKSFNAEFFKQICTEDLCGIAKHVGKSKCAFNAGSAEPGYIASYVNFWWGTTIQTNGFYCHTF